jgi:hypothetical protein
VYDAVLADGTQMAVKVQRPSLDRQGARQPGVAQLMGRCGERRSTWALSVPFRERGAARDGTGDAGVPARRGVPCGVSGSI